MNRYIDGMNEIKASDELKKSIINDAKKYQSKGFAFQKTTALLAAVCTFILLAMFGLSFLQPNSDKPLFDGFVLTAYAADGTPVEIKPNVGFPLGKYQMTMSSVPGFPINIVSGEADVISLRATDGSFLLWTPPASKVVNKGTQLEIKSGDTVYWSPLSDGVNKTVAKSAIEVIAYQNDKELGRRTIEINRKDDYSYSGILVEK
ncbi:MAG: hypothetical protein ACQEXQ_27935 [Bacillota bacterium]